MYDFYSYYYDTPTVESYFDSAILSLAFGIFAIAAFCALFVCLGLYVLKSIALYRIAENRGMKDSFLALIPVAGIYYMGKIADDIDATMNKRSESATKLLLLSVATLVLGVMSIPFCFIFTAMGSYFFVSLSYIMIFLGAVVGVCFAVCYYSALYKIYKEYSPENATVLEVFSILFFISPIVLFVIRNKKSGYSIWLENKENEKKADAGYDFPANGYDEKPAKEETDSDADVDTDSDTDSDSDNTI